MTKVVNTGPLKLLLIENGWIKEDATILSIIKDCLITESFTGKSYTYRLINFIDGSQKYLFHKKVSLQGEEIKGIEEKLMTIDFYDKHYPDSGEGLIKYIFEVVFKIHGYSIREEQVDLSMQMYKAMIDKKISLSDVPVGLGKTHAYLVAAIVYRLSVDHYKHSAKPVIITTSSIELQRAIVKDYLPEISEMLLNFGIIDRPITSVIRKGKDNYLCVSRLRNYIENVDPKRKKLEELITLRQIEGIDEIDLDEIQGVSSYDRKRICVNYNPCQVCMQKNICKYQLFMRAARKPNIHIQVCNHNYYLADIIRRRKGLSSLLPDNDVVIIDEAHKLIDAARQMYGVSINQRDIYVLAKKAIPMKIKDKDSKHLKHLGEELIKYSTLMFTELVNNIPSHIDRDETEKFETVLTSIGRVYLSRIISSAEEIIRLTHSEDKKYISDIRRIVKDLKVFQNWGIIYWIEKPFLKGQCVFASTPIALNKELGVDLWQTEDSKILTSGTLAVKNDFEYLKNEIGIKEALPKRVSELSKESPFDYKENCLVHIPEKLPYSPNIDEKYLTQIANKVEELIKASNGHAMVLFTSYKPLKIVYDKLKHRLTDNNTILMTRGKKEAINQFKQSNNGVLFATGSAWEGINIPGDRLSHLIIVKLPFPIPDPISEYERTMYSSLEAYIDAVVVPKMLIKLRQGVGRLIRKETDTGVISILDARAACDGRYHESVLDALPKCRVAKNSQEISQFFHDKKTEEFFRRAV